MIIFKTIQKVSDNDEKSDIFDFVTMGLFCVTFGGTFLYVKLNDLDKNVCYKPTLVVIEISGRTSVIPVGTGALQNVKEKATVISFSHVKKWMGNENCSSD